MVDRGGSAGFLSAIQGRGRDRSSRVPSTEIRPPLGVNFSETARGAAGISPQAHRLSALPMQPGLPAHRSADLRPLVSGSGTSGLRLAWTSAAALSMSEATASGCET